MRKKEYFAIYAIVTSTVLSGCNAVTDTVDTPTSIITEVPTISLIPTEGIEPTEAVEAIPTVNVEPTVAPIITEVPKISELPIATETPVVTEVVVAPTEMVKPTVSVTPEPTATPVAKLTVTVQATPKPTATPKPVKVTEDTIMQVPGTSRKEPISYMGVTAIKDAGNDGKLLQVDTSGDGEVGILSCGWEDSNGNCSILPDGWSLNWRVTSENESYINMFPMEGNNKAYMWFNGSELSGDEPSKRINVYADIITNTGDIVCTRGISVVIYNSFFTGKNVGGSSTQTFNGIVDGNLGGNTGGSGNNSGGAEAKPTPTSKPSSEGTGNHKYVTGLEETINVTAKEKAILDKDYSEVSAKDIIRYYVDIERYGSQALNETEAECQAILKRIDTVLDEVFSNGDKYINGDEYTSRAYRLAVQCEMLMSYMYTEDTNSHYIGNNGEIVTIPEELELAYSYANSSQTGTGKYFIEAFINRVTDCQGGDFATQLLINRAAHRAGLDKSELYAYGVDQGGDHRISIICVDGYFCTYGYDENIGQVKSFSGIPNFDKKKVFQGSGELMSALFYKINKDGTVTRTTDKYAMSIYVGVDAAAEPNSSCIYIYKSRESSKLIIPDWVDEVNIVNKITNIKELVIGKKVKKIEGFRKVTHGVERVEFLGDQLIDFNIDIDHPWVQKEIEERGYFTLPSNIEPCAIEEQTPFLVDSILMKKGIPVAGIDVTERDGDPATFQPKYFRDYTFGIHKDQVWQINWATYYGVKYVIVD